MVVALAPLPYTTSLAASLKEQKQALKIGTREQSLLVSVFAAPVQISEDVGDACVGAHEGCGAIVEQGPDTEYGGHFSLGQSACYL